jgi:hypothetical protein
VGWLEYVVRNVFFCGVLFARTMSLASHISLHAGVCTKGDLQTVTMGDWFIDDTCGGQLVGHVGANACCLHFTDQNLVEGLFARCLGM